MKRKRKSKPKSKVKKPAKKRVSSLKKKTRKKVSVKKVKPKFGKKSKGKTPKKFTANKRRGKNIWEINLPKFVKTKSILNSLYSKIQTRIKKFPDDQVKVTLYASHKKHKGGMTYIYDLPKSKSEEKNNKVFQDILRRMTRDIFNARANKQDGYLKHATIKDRIDTIIIDFETND